MSKKNQLKFILTSFMFRGPFSNDIWNVDNGPQGSAFYQPKRKKKKGKRK